MTVTRPLKHQNANFWVQKLCFLLMVSLSWILALREIEDKTYNLKIGFDLTHGSEGGSALRIRNFEENDETGNSKPALRAGLPTSSSSSSNEDENDEKKKEIHDVAVERKGAEDSAQSDDSDGSDGLRKQRSTKGLRADEFEPQGPQDPDPFDNNSESENSN